MPSTGQQQVRDPKTGKFCAGNRSGGRKEIPEKVKQMLEAATPEACKLLIEYMSDELIKPELRIKCAEIVLDRTYGKPRQAVDLDAASLPPVVFVGNDNIPD